MLNEKQNTTHGVYTIVFFIILSGLHSAQDTK